MGMMQEFREFAIKGNVIDLAVGVIIGAAFGKIVDSIVADIINPIIGMVVGKIDFSSLYIVLSGADKLKGGESLEAARKAGASVLAWGNLTTILINFAILAFIIFLMVKQINKMKREAPAAPAAPPEDVVLLREIRDSLKK
jgi:large conductance mechanosensitive channel